MGQILVIVGGVIGVIGAGLWIGNVTGKFHTFPFAGYITMGIGGAIVAFGRKKQAEEAGAYVLTETSATKLIVEDGSVQRASVVSAPEGKQSAASCVEKALRRATFATHCGDAVDIRWTYSLLGG